MTAGRKKEISFLSISIISQQMSLSIFSTMRAQLLGSLRMHRYALTCSYWTELYCSDQFLYYAKLRLFTHQPDHIDHIYTVTTID